MKKEEFFDILGEVDEQKVIEANKLLKRVAFAKYESLEE